MTAPNEVELDLHQQTDELTKAHGPAAGMFVAIVLNANNIAVATNFAAHTDCGTQEHEQAMASVQNFLQEMAHAYLVGSGLNEAGAEAARNLAFKIMADANAALGNAQPAGIAPDGSRLQ
jgi:alcohol dehydrogenase class IV